MNSGFNIGEAAWTTALLALGGFLGLLISPHLQLDRNTLLTSVLPPFFAAGLGGYAAYLGIRRNQQITREEAKVDHINRHIYKLVGCLLELCNIKMRYSEALGTGLYRTLSLRQSVNSTVAVIVDISDIQFLSAGNVVGQKPEIDLILIDTALRNYNLALEIRIKRDREHGVFLEAARESGAVYLGDGSMEGSVKELIAQLGQDKVDLLVHTGEHLLQTIDIAIDQLAEGLDQLQTFAREKINRNLIPGAIIAKYYLDIGSPPRKAIEEPFPKGEWVNSRLYDEPLPRYPKRDRLMPTQSS